MSAEARVMSILRDGEQSSAQIAKRWPWWAWLWPWGMYPALIRLERIGMIESRWADGPHPRARLYRAKDIGLEPLEGRK
jgi:DNA-binding PadR family transcriptional regulator